MKTKTIELWVGFFMIAGIAALLILALQVSGLGNFFVSPKGYKIYAEFRNIGGLKVRAKVSLAGVVVGRVASITLEPNTYNAMIEMILDPTRIEKLPADSRASILTAGLLGDNYVGLQPGFEETEFLKEGAVISSRNTDSALQLEQLVSKFVAGQASKPRPVEKNVSPAAPAASSNPLSTLPTTQTPSILTPAPTSTSISTPEETSTPSSSSTSTTSNTSNTTEKNNEN